MSYKVFRLFPLFKKLPWIFLFAKISLSEDRITRRKRVVVITEAPHATIQRNALLGTSPKLCSLPLLHVYMTFSLLYFSGTLVILSLFSDVLKIYFTRFVDNIRRFTSNTLLHFTQPLAPV